MNSDEYGFLISFIFLLICFYSLATFLNLSVDADLPVLGRVSVSFEDYFQYMIPIVLLLSFAIFLKVRKERQNGENNQQFE